MTNIQVQVRFKTISGLPKDDIENGWAFTTPTPFDSSAQTALEAAIRDFYTTPPPLLANSIEAYLSTVIVRTTVVHEMKFFDVSASLGGAPHGPPVGTALFGIGTTQLSDKNLPNQDACVLSLNGHTTQSLLPVAEVVATDEEGIDEGAPATHGAISRPLERQRGRLYLGPFNDAATTNTILHEPRVSDVLRQIMIAAAKKLILDLGTAFVWSIWSKAAATFYPVVSGWVDDRWDAQRRRESPPTGRLFFP